jgi:hypothetical protein
MPTRRTDNAERNAQERYMSSPEIAGRRGLLGNLVAAKAQLCSSAAHRNLFFFLQGLSLRGGGLMGIAAELFNTFPDRFLECDSGLLSSDQSQELARLQFRAILNNQCRIESPQLRWFAEFLESLCMDPALDIREAQASTPYFRDPIGALFEYRKRFDALGEFRVTTSIGAELHKALDRVLATRRMVVIEGLSGIGKSFAAEQWCRRHLGEARFVTLSGITHRTGLFQKIGSALGLGICQHASSKLQAKIEAHLERTKLMLVIDEAQFLWPQHNRSHSAPELIDWVDTALVNNGVPVALISTDQFAKRKAHVEKQTGWTSDQFLHRTWRYIQLSAKPTNEDLRGVAKVLLSHRWSAESESWNYDADLKPDATGARVIAAYGASNLLPLGSIRSIIDDARVTAQESGRDFVTLADIKQGLEAQEGSDVAIRRAFESTANVRRRRSSKIIAEPESSERQMSNFPAPADADRPAHPRFASGLSVIA